MSSSPSLPSLLPSNPALDDPHTTPEQFEQAEKLAKVTSPEQQVTPIYICAFKDCHRLFPSGERLRTHRKREHGGDSEDDIISWNASE